MQPDLPVLALARRKLKLDENLGVRGRELLRNAGFDVATVVEQGLAASADVTLIEVCRAEDRCLVTLDLDFANPLRFPPGRYPGIVVLRIRTRISLEAVEAACDVFIEAVSKRQVFGRLWIVDGNRVREYDARAPEPG